jgi:hypothetical protein
MQDGQWMFSALMSKAKGSDIGDSKSFKVKHSYSV